MTLRRTPIARSTKPIPRSRPKPRATKPKAVNAKRKKTNWHRAHHSAERVRFVQGLSCIVQGCPSPKQDVMHIRSGGMGRKAHYTETVPCCRTHHRFAHQRGIDTFLAHFPVPAPLDTLAQATEAGWLAHLDRELADGE